MQILNLVVTLVPGNIQPVEHQGIWVQSCNYLSPTSHDTGETHVAWEKTEDSLYGNVMLPYRLQWLLIGEWEIQEICKAQLQFTVTEWMEDHPQLAFIKWDMHTHESWHSFPYSSDEVKPHPFSTSLRSVLLKSILLFLWTSLAISSCHTWVLWLVCATKIPLGLHGTKARDNEPPPHG